MSKIIAIKSVKTKAGKPNVLVSTAEKDHWCPYGSWIAKGASEALDAYVGGDFQADYFQEGELLLSGDAVTASDVILRDFVVTMNPMVVAGIAAIGVQQKGAEMQQAAAIFRRRRTDALAKATADAELAAARALANGPAPLTEA